MRRPSGPQPLHCDFVRVALPASSTRHGLLSPGPLQHAQPVLEANLLDQRLSKLSLAHSSYEIREASS